MDTCNATIREGSRMYVCQREHRHPERTHKDVTFEWPVEAASYAGETPVDLR